MLRHLVQNYNYHIIEKLAEYLKKKAFCFVISISIRYNESKL